MAERSDCAHADSCRAFSSDREPWHGGRESLVHMDMEMRRRARDLTKKSAESLKKKGIKTQTAVLQSDARSVVVHEAEKWKANLIVMGSHGCTGTKCLLLSSVASSVVSHAPCSVEIVGQQRKKTR
jgi:nucleotide-binding universal stress UspA family protein